MNPDTSTQDYAKGQEREKREEKLRCRIQSGDTEIEGLKPLAYASLRDKISTFTHARRERGGGGGKFDVILQGQYLENLGESQIKHKRIKPVTIQVPSNSNGHDSSQDAERNYNKPEHVRQKEREAIKSLGKSTKTIPSDRVANVAIQRDGPTRTSIGKLAKEAARDDSDIEQREKTPFFTKTVQEQKRALKVTSSVRAHLCTSFLAKSTVSRLGSEQRHCEGDDGIVDRSAASDRFSPAEPQGKKRRRALNNKHKEHAKVQVAKPWRQGMKKSSGGVASASFPRAQTHNRKIPMSDERLEQVRKPGASYISRLT